VRNLWMIFLIPCLVAFGSAAANAQEPGKLAAVVGASTSNLTGVGTAGALWQFSNHFAVRGDFSITHSYTAYHSSYTQSTSEETSRAVAAGASVLITLHKQDNLRIYVSPRYAYSFKSYATEFTGEYTSPPTSSSYDRSSYPKSWSASFGGQYNFSHRFGVFGESGVENV